LCILKKKKLLLAAVVLWKVSMTDRRHRARCILTAQLAEFRAVVKNELMFTITPRAWPPRISSTVLVLVTALLYTDHPPRTLELSRTQFHSVIEGHQLRLSIYYFLLAAIIISTIHQGVPAPLTDPFCSMPVVPSVCITTEPLTTF